MSDQPSGSTGSRASDPLAAVAQPMSALRDQTSAIIRVGGAPHGPDWQVVGFGSVWISSEPRHLVERLDPATNEVVSRVKVPVPCDGLGAGFGSIWIPDCLDHRIVRVDGATGRVVARIPTSIAGAEHGGEGFIDVGEGGVWVLTAPDTLARIDPKTNEVADTVHVADGSYAVAVGFGSVWVSSFDGDVVTRVDPAGRVSATIPVGPSPLFLAAGEGSVWVLNQDDGTVSRIDPATNEVTTIEAGSAGDGGCIAVGLGAVWVTIPAAPLTRIDPGTGSVTEQYRGNGGDCLSVGFGSVWLSNHQFGTVWRIDPAN